MSRGSAGLPSPRMRRASARPLSMISENPADDSTGASKVNVTGVARIGTKGIKGQGQKVQGRVMNSSNPSACKNNNNSTNKNNMSLVPKPVPTRRKAVAPLQHPVTVLLDKGSDNSVRSTMTTIHSPTSPRFNNGVVEHDEKNVFISENGVAERNNNKKVPFLENGVSSENPKRVLIPETTSTVSSIIKRFSSLSHDKNNADFDCVKSTNNVKGNTRCNNPHSQSSSIPRLTSKSKDTNENPRTLSQNSSNNDQDSGIVSDNNVESPEILDGNHNDISWKSANNKTLGDSIAEEKKSGWVHDDDVLILTSSKHNNCNRQTPENTDSASRLSSPHDDGDSPIKEIHDVNHLQNNDDDGDDDDIAPASPELTSIDYSLHETKNNLTTSCCECKMKKMNNKSSRQNFHQGLAVGCIDRYNDAIILNNGKNDGNNNGAVSLIQSENQTTHPDNNTSNGSPCSSCSSNNTPYQSPASAHDDSVFIYSDNNHTQDDEICFLTSTPKFKTTTTMVLSSEGIKNNSYDNHTTTQNTPNLKTALTSAIEEDNSNSQQPPQISESKNGLLSQTPPPRPFHKAHSDSEAIKLFKTTNDQEFITDNNNKTHHCSSPSLDGETLEWKKRVTRSVSLIKAPSFTSDHNGPKRRISSIHPPGHHSNLSIDILPEDFPPTSFQNRFNDKSSSNNDKNTAHSSDVDNNNTSKHLNKDDDNNVGKSKLIIQNISDEPVRRISAIDQSNFSLLKVATTRLNLPTRRASVTAWKEKYLNKQGPPLPSSDTDTTNTTTTTTSNNNNTIYTTTTTTNTTTNQANNNSNDNNINSSTNNDSSAYDCKGTNDISSPGKPNESKSSDHTNTTASSKEEQWKLTEDVKNRINNSLAWLRQELIDIRIQDQSLARQFLDIREAMNDFRLVVECEDHQDLIQDVQEDMENIRELSQLVDIPTRDIQTLSSSLSPLKHVGVTRMNISSRRFSTC